MFEFGTVQRYIYFVALEKCGKISMWSQKLASIQPRTSPVKFARSPRTDPTKT